MKYKNIDFQEHGDPLTADILNALNFEAKLPEDYMQFLLKVNGGVPDKSIFEFTDIDGKKNHDEILAFFGLTSRGNNIIETFQYRGKIIPQRMIILADALDANMILMSLKNPDRGKIYHWDSRFESEIINAANVGEDLISFIANNFEEFLSKLLPASDFDLEM